MPRQDTSRRQQLVAGLKAATVTAAIVGTVGGWVAFGAQPEVTTIDTTTSAVAQVATSSNTTVPTATLEATATATTDSTSPTATATTAATATPQPTTAPQPTVSSSTSTRRSPITTTRSSR